ncbi:hypothetical protein AWC15_14115 [Mycobacterium lacus]|uniref:Uncharacterized protein n=1 Tax=Mycobacterium lacus TaxID=169765 RepID=A0A1X1YR78_9MYCO|nr:hypothetical protein AWC15_14115 [Mycobacterium lacus]BBX98268.1 hypothetical protein MLAC_35620 [Mycobacterium lacus]
MISDPFAQVLLDAVGDTRSGLAGVAVAELDRGNTAGDIHRRRDARRVRVRKLLDELRNSLTDAERAQVKAAERQLYDDAGLPS